jgi:phage terminase small subunit
MTATRKFTPKQAAFIEEHAVDMNATQAAIRAGYSAKTAGWIGPQLLAKTHIAAAIAEKRADRSIRTEITADRVLQELARTAFHDPLSAFDAQGKLLPLHEIDPATRSAMMIEITEGFDGDGNPVTTRKTKFKDRDAALDKLCRNLGLFQDKLKISGDSENPLLVLIQRINGQHSAIQPVIEGRVEDYGSYPAS